MERGTSRVPESKLQVFGWRVDLLVSEQQFLLVRCLSRQAGENSKKVQEIF